MPSQTRTAVVKVWALKGTVVLVW